MSYNILFKGADEQFHHFLDTQRNRSSVVVGDKSNREMKPLKLIKIISYVCVELKSETRLNPSAGRRSIDPLVLK